MVDGCLFKGEVGTESSYNAGGFVGRTDDSPVILRCGEDATVANASEQPYAGGFIGYHNGGFVKDSYAVGDVYGNTGVGGFAGYLGASPRIAASWCSVGIGSEGGWTGAFVGYANGMGLVTNAYYDASRNDDYLNAQGKQYSSGSDDYFGISAVNDILSTNGFPALDFENTWFIDPIEQHPCLQALQSSAYEHWLDYNAGLPWYLEPDAIVNGIPAGARYVFGIDPNKGPADFPGPLLDIGFDANGVPCVKLPPLANTEGATVEVLSAGDLSDWSGADANPVDPATGVCVPDLGDPPPDRAFFRYRIRIGED